METKSKPFLVGVFALLTLLAGFLFTAFILQFENGANKKQFYVLFAGSVQGLSEGSPVYYNGLKVGDVRTLELNPKKSTEVRALLNVDTLTPLKADTRVLLSYQGVTGIASVEITGGSPWLSDLKPSAEGELPSLFGEPSGLQSIIDQAEDTMRELNKLLKASSEKIEAISTSQIQKSMEDIGRFTAVLGNNAAAIDQVIGDLALIASDAKDISSRLNRFTASLEGEEGNGLVPQAMEAIEAIRNTAVTLEQQTKRIAGNLESFTGEGLDDVQSFVQEGQRAVKDIRAFLKTVEDNPQQFIFGKESLPTYQGR